jgi:hypothetical protein
MSGQYVNRLLNVFIRRRQWGEASPDEPPVRTKCGLVAVTRIERVTRGL